MLSSVNWWQRLQEADGRHPWVLDSALALALLIASLVSVLLSAPEGPGAVQLGLTCLAAVPYAFRRLAPLPVLFVASSLVLALLVLGYGTPVIGSALFLACYTVAAHRGWRSTLVGAGLCLALLVIVFSLPGRMQLAEAATNLALFTGAFAVGRAARTHRDTARLEAERADLAERAQLESARTAVSEERLRIARELHDVVGHSLGVIALQAGVGARVADSDPVEAKSALTAIAERSRSSLHEVRQILAALRDPDEDNRPVPGLDDVDELLAQVASAGLRVDLVRTGARWPLSRAMDLTAYRVLQESLTNVVRHAGTEDAWVRIEYSPDRLTLRVRDRGRGRQAASPGGTGQLGMRERLAIWGGTLEAGDAPDGGYEVVAVLPRGQEEES